MTVRSYCLSNTLWTTSMVHKLAFNLIKRYLVKLYEIFLSLLPNPNFKIFFITISMIKLGC